LIFNLNFDIRDIYKLVFRQQNYCSSPKDLGKDLGSKTLHFPHTKGKEHLIDALPIENS
jgi:hypothetical protein